MIIRSASMMKIIVSIFFVLLVTSTIGVDGQAECSAYVSDKEVIASYPSLISINPTNGTCNTSYARVNDDRWKYLFTGLALPQPIAGIGLRPLCI